MSEVSKELAAARLLRHRLKQMVRWWDQLTAADAERAQGDLEATAWVEEETTVRERNNQ